MLHHVSTGIVVHIPCLATILSHFTLAQSACTRSHDDEFRLNCGMPFKRNGDCERDRERPIWIPFCMCTNSKHKKNLLCICESERSSQRKCAIVRLCVCVLIASFCFFIISRVEQRLLCIFKRNEEKKKTWYKIMIEVRLAARRMSLVGTCVCIRFCARVHSETKYTQTHAVRNSYERMPSSAPQQHAYMRKHSMNTMKHARQQPSTQTHTSVSQRLRMFRWLSFSSMCLCMCWCRFASSLSVYSCNRRKL